MKEERRFDGNVVGGRKRKILKNNGEKNWQTQETRNQDKQGRVLVGKKGKRDTRGRETVRGTTVIKHI